MLCAHTAGRLCSRKFGIIKVWIRFFFNGWGCLIFSSSASSSVVGVEMGCLEGFWKGCDRALCLVLIDIVGLGSVWIGWGGWYVLFCFLFVCLLLVISLVSDVYLSFLSLSSEQSTPFSTKLFGSIWLGSIYLKPRMLDLWYLAFLLRTHHTHPPIFGETGRVDGVKNKVIKNHTTGDPPHCIKKLVRNVISTLISTRLPWGGVTRLSQWWWLKFW